MNKNRNISARQLSTGELFSLVANSRLICQALLKDYRQSLRLEAEKKENEWFSLVRNKNLYSFTKQITKINRDFLLEEIPKSPYHLHITIQPRYYDKWDDVELTRLAEHTDFLLSQRFLKGSWRKFCNVDRFQYVVNFHSPRKSKHRHCHILLYIPFHMLNERDENGMKNKMTGSNDEMKRVVGETYRQCWLEAYPTDRITMTRYAKSFMNKDGSVNSFRQLEHMRLKEPYIQEIPDTMKDLTRVIGYDMKETFKPDRLQDMFFSETNNKNKAVISQRL